MKIEISKKENQNGTMLKKRYLREEAVSEMTNLSLQTLRNHRFEGKGLPYIKFGRAVRYDEDEVIASLEACKIRPRDQGV